MEEITFVKIDDGRECIVIDEFNYNDNKYVIMVNSLNRYDYIVRKVINNELIGLKDEEEFKNVFIHFMNNKIGDKNGN